MSQKNSSLVATAWMAGGALTALAGLSYLGLALLPIAGGDGLVDDPLVILSSVVVIILGGLVLNEGRSMRRVVHHDVPEATPAHSVTTVTPAQADIRPASDPKPLPAHALAFVEELSRISSERATDRDSSASAVETFIRNLSEPAAENAA